MAEAAAETGSAAAEKVQDKSSPAPNGAAPAVPLRIPMTFDRWFWTPDYRTGVTVLFEKLRSGLKESEELVNFIRTRAEHERTYGYELRGSLAGARPDGFGADDGASFLAAYRQLRVSQADLADAHKKVAKQLDILVLAPFEDWSVGHKDRVLASIEEVEAVLERWEDQSKEVARLKERYERKGREADEAEDEARFAPAKLGSPTTPAAVKPSSYLPLPSILRRTETSTSEAPNDLADDDTLVGQSGVPTGEGAGALGKKVGEQALGLGRAFTQRVRAGGGRVGFRATSVDVPPKDPDNEQIEVSEKDLPAVDTATDPEKRVQSPSEITPVVHTAEEKGKAKAVDPSSPPPAVRRPPVPETKESLFVGEGTNNPGGVKLLEIAGIVRPPFEWSRLFAKARDTIYKQSVKVPVLGTYEGAQDGESLAIFFKREVPELEGDDEWTFRFCRELSEDLAVLRLIGELGNQFVAAPDAFYVWKPEAFQLHGVATSSAPNDFSGTYTALPERQSNLHSPRPPSPVKSQSTPVRSPEPGSGTLFGWNRVAAASQSGRLTAPPGESGNLVRSGTIASYFRTAVSSAAKGINDLGTTVATAAADRAAAAAEPRHERLRREALEAEKTYATFVRNLDRSRLFLEETIAEHLAFLQRCELDRLRAAKSVILGFNAAIASLSPVLKQNDDRNAVVHESFSPEADIVALVERYQTGSFRPQPSIFHCHWGERVDVNFGINLMKWYEGQEVAAIQGKEIFAIPPILSALLNHLNTRYGEEDSHAERRKWWIYDVPLRSTHALREAINDPETPVSGKLLDRVDGPVIAATVKLWLLELDPAPVPAQRYDDIKAIFADDKTPADVRAEALQAILSRLPKVHLLVLDAVVSHLKALFESTTTEEDSDLFLTKLGLSVSRSLLRPLVETPVTLSDRFQSHFLIDLIKQYDSILPPAIEHQKKHEHERVRPKRQRTRPVDMRVRRSLLPSQENTPNASPRKAQAATSGPATGSPRAPPALGQPSAPPKPVEPSPAVPAKEVSVSSPPRAPVPTLAVPPEPEDLPFTPPTGSGPPASTGASDALAIPPAASETASPAATEYADAPLASTAQLDEAPPAEPVHEHHEDDDATPTIPPVEHFEDAPDDAPLATTTDLSREKQPSLKRTTGLRGPRTSGLRGPRPDASTTKVKGSVDSLRAQFEPSARH